MSFRLSIRRGSSKAAATRRVDAVSYGQCRILRPMPRRWPVFACRALVFLAALAVARALRAADATPTVGISCPEMTGDDRAALEARARAELSIAPPGSATVVLDCAAKRVIVAGSGGTLERTVADDVRGVALADELVNALHALVTEARGAKAETGGQTGAGSGVAPAHSEKAAQNPTGTAVTEEAAAPGGGIARLRAAAGADAELWSGEAPVAIGGHVGARVSTGARWDGAIDAGALSIVEGAQGIAVWALRAALGVDYAPVDALSLGLGADARLVVASASASASPTSQAGTTLGALVTARYALRAGRLQFLVGPRAELFARPVIVEVEKSEVLRLPVFVAGVSLEGAIDL
jgi:hypothetical protein